MPMATLSRRAALAILAAAAGAAGLARPLSAQGTGRPDLNADPQGVMLHGHDPVAYFTGGAPAKGSAELTAVHDGGTYHFASAANRDAFLADPARYVPAYGGFCAMGTALERKVDGDPEVWRIVAGRLYLNVNADVQERWNDDVPGNIATADKAWPKIKDVPAGQLGG